MLLAFQIMKLLRLIRSSLMACSIVFVPNIWYTEEQSFIIFDVYSAPFPQVFHVNAYKMSQQEDEWWFWSTHRNKWQEFKNYPLSGNDIMRDMNILTNFVPIPYLLSCAVCTHLHMIFVTNDSKLGWFLVDV